MNPRTTLRPALLLVAAGTFCAGLGCTRQTDRGPVGWSAGDASAMVGQTDAQAWSRSTSAAEHARGVTERQAAPSDARIFAGAIELPPGTALTATSRVEEVHAFPEEAAAPSDDGAATPTRGTNQAFLNGRPYGEVVDFFDRTFDRESVQVLRITRTSTATLWSLRTPGGEAHLAVRNTHPTTIELVASDSRP